MWLKYIFLEYFTRFITFITYNWKTYLNSFWRIQISIDIGKYSWKILCVKGSNHYWKTCWDSCRKRSYCWKNSKIKNFSSRKEFSKQVNSNCSRAFVWNRKTKKYYKSNRILLERGKTKWLFCLCCFGKDLLRWRTCK